MIWVFVFEKWLDTRKKTKWWLKRRRVNDHGSSSPWCKRKKGDKRQCRPRWRRQRLIRRAKASTLGETDRDSMREDAVHNMWCQKWNQGPQNNQGKSRLPVLILGARDSFSIDGKYMGLKKSNTISFLGNRQPFYWPKKIGYRENRNAKNRGGFIVKIATVWK